MKDLDLIFLKDQLINSMEHYSITDFIEVMNFLPHEKARKIFYNYWKINPSARYSMYFDWDKWIKSQLEN